MRTTSRALCALLLLCCLSAVPAQAQRMQFPTMMAADGSVGAPATSGGPAGPSTFAPNVSAGPTSVPTIQTPPPTFDPYANPALQPPTTYSPYTASPYSTAPSPYGAPPYAGAAEGQPLYPNGIQPLAPQGDWMQTVQQPLKFLQELRLRSAWLAGIGGAKALQVVDVDTSATFAVPIRYGQAPLLITPGGGLHFWSGPLTTPTQPADLPPVTYDVYLDTAWRPQITPWLSADLGVRTGLYTDFHAVNNHSIRILGRGVGLVTLTPTVQLAAGIVYLDRVLIKMLPAGGVIWTPNPDARYEILFPNPKLSRRFRTLGTTDLWWHVAGEYGGGSWTIRRANGNSDQFDYNDIRIMLGLDSYAHSGLQGLFEVGYVSDRQLVYRSGMPSRFFPSDTIMLRGGVSY